MRSVTTLMEIVLVLAIGVGLAFGANAIRPRETRVDIHYAYVKPPSAPIGSQPAGQGHGDVAAPVATGESVGEPKAPDGTNGDGDPGTDGHGGDASHAGSGQHGEAQAAPPKSKHVAHEFQTITADEIADLLGSPDLLTGLTVIVDARDDDHFSGPDGGHIPGALQCFPYEPARFIPQITPHVTNAMKVIVYCNGGSCDDSVMMCRTFRDELTVPQENLFLYEGGWEDWKERGLPVEKGE